MTHRILPALGALFLLTACDATPPGPAPEPRERGTSAPVAAAPQPARDTAVSTPVASVAPKGDTAAPRSCAAEIGAAAADRRAAVCRSVSPATRPPCNAANSCAVIEDETARGCAFLGEDAAATEGCRPLPRTMAAAVAVVRRYYAALDARDYGTAWRQWGEDGPAGQPLDKFAAGFAQTRSTRVTIGAVAPGDAGAGSTYQPVPVTVNAVLMDGRRQRFTGSYVVRRVNDVDGATLAQRRWHIDSARLRPL